jgi:hypothetical protein
MSEAYQKSNEIFYDNIKWLLSSDIRTKKGQHKGAPFAWNNLNPILFPFIFRRGHSNKKLRGQVSIKIGMNISGGASPCFFFHSSSTVVYYLTILEIENITKINISNNRFTE